MFEEVLESLVLTMCAMKGKRIFHGQLTLETDNGRKLLEFKFGGESILLSREKNFINFILARGTVRDSGCGIFQMFSNVTSLKWMEKNSNICNSNINTHVIFQNFISVCDGYV